MLIICMLTISLIMFAFPTNFFVCLCAALFCLSLNQEASSILGSCGLSDKVYNFMRARKRSCIQEAGNKPSGTDLKYVLINLTSVQFHRCSEL